MTGLDRPLRPSRFTLLVLTATTSAAAIGVAGLAAAPAPATQPAERVGGANSPPPAPPPKLVVETAELSAGAFAVKVPTGTYTAPAGGAAAYSVPGPIVAFKGPDGVWRGHGYLETYPRLLSFEGQVQGAAATLAYRFENGKSYTVKLQAKDGVILMDETSDLGPRNLYVFDCFYGGWEPSAGLATDLAGKNHAFLYLPCFYDKPEVSINPIARGAATQPALPVPGGVAVLAADPAQRDLAGFWCRDLASWSNGDRMGVQLWQRRQLPGDPGSRHFQGPETKSDSTPNPRTAGLMGQSLYEGHVTIEFSLGQGRRLVAFGVTGKPADRAATAEAFKALVKAGQ